MIDRQRLVNAYLQKKAGPDHSRFQDHMDKITEKVLSAKSYRDLDLITDTIVTYVTQGIRQGYLPKSFRRTYNKLTQGSGIAGFSGELQNSQEIWVKVLQEMKKASIKKEKKGRS